MFAIKNKFFGMKDDKFNSIVAFCKKLPSEKLTLKELFTEAIKDDPKLVLEIAKAFIKSKFK